MQFNQSLSEVVVGVDISKVALLPLDRLLECMSIRIEKSTGGLNCDLHETIFA
jgi:hypothetical protein